MSDHRLNSESMGQKVFKEYYWLNRQNLKLVCMLKLLNLIIDYDFIYYILLSDLDDYTRIFFKKFHKKIAKIKILKGDRLWLSNKFNSVV